jgi:hypothetical protein
LYFYLRRKLVCTLKLKPLRLPKERQTQRLLQKLSRKEEAKAAEIAQRKADAEAAAEAKRKRDAEREAARVELQRVFDYSFIRC